MKICFICHDKADEFMCMGDHINIDDNEYLYHSEQSWDLCHKHAMVVYQKPSSKEFWRDI